MSARSTIRGNDIIWKNNKWIYVCNKKDINKAKMPCIKCNKMPTS